jgi:hypothetical protein
MKSSGTQSTDDIVVQQSSGYKGIKLCQIEVFNGKIICQEWLVY